MIAGTNFQHLRVILNLLEGGSEQLRRCVPGEASDTRSSRPVPVFVEFKYSVIYGKMFLEQEITDAEVSTSYADY